MVVRPQNVAEPLGVSNVTPLHHSFRKLPWRETKGRTIHATTRLPEGNFRPEDAKAARHQKPGCPAPSVWAEAVITRQFQHMFGFRTDLCAPVWQSAHPLPVASVANSKRSPIDHRSFAPRFRSYSSEQLCWALECILIARLNPQSCGPIMADQYFAT